MIAVLYTMPDSPYAGISGVDCWGQERDARLYPGPHAVVAHSPCARWGRYWFGGPSAKVRRKLGDDDGCFAAAIAAVRQYGGVLEHPEASHAWPAHGLKAPPRCGGWYAAGDWLGWTCCVEQGHYGHPARKATWLYAVGCELPQLIWGRSSAGQRMDQGYHSAQERRRAQKLGTVSRLTRRQRLATPPAFRDMLIAMARSVPQAPAPAPTSPRQG